MATLDYKSIAQDMLAAMQDAVGSHIEDVRELAEDELEDFAKRSAILTEKVVDGKLNQEQARAILRIRQNAVETVLLSISGISVITARDAVRSGVNVLRSAINSAIPGVSIL